MSVRSPLPDWRDFKRQILSWDFYQDIVDEAKTRREEEEKVHEEIKDTKLAEKEVEAFLHNLKNLTPLQKRRLEERIAEQKAELEDMADDDNRKKEMLKRNQRIAKKNKANAMALERIHQRAAEKGGVVKVPEHFEDEAHYMSSWLPSFYLECQAQIQRYKETEMSKETEHMRFNRFQLDADHLVKLTLTRTKEGIAIRQFSMEDLVLLTQEEDLSKPHPVHMMGLVEHSVSNLIVMTIFTDMAVTTKGSRSKEVADLIAKEAPWYVVKITSMSTQIREFQALKGFQDIYLKDYILNRDDSGVVGDASTEMQAASALELGSTEAPVARADLISQLPEVLEKWLLEKFNPSQMNAIRDSLKVEGITLIQGPPGTGKTSTVLALLAVLLASRKAKEKRKSRKSGASEVSTVGEDSDEEQERVKKLKVRCPWLRANFVPFSDQEWQEVVRPGDALRKPYTKEQVTPVSDEEDGRTPQKVLVCAPSNAAVDEVLRRVHRDGFLGDDGTFFKPEMTRVGPGAHSDIRKAYALREQIDRRLAGCDAPDHNKREEEKDAVLSLARIIFSTLAMAGSRDMVGCPEDFDTVLVDEACQGVELSTLIPLKLGCRRLILIGDPNQLPATVFSELAKDYSNYARSLFQRLQVTHYKVNMLNTQYRMHPAISRFPSENFYDGSLLDHLDWKAFEAKNPTKWSHIPCFAPVAFFNIAGKMSQGSKSYANEEEAEFIVNMVSVLQSLFPDQDWRRKIGVISPYAEQVRLLKAMFKEKYGIKSIHDPCPVEVNTVDGFQGNEKDCIIVSLVREAIQRSNSVGFLADRRRMNVAFTRARMNLWVVGNANFLSVNADWEDFIEKVQAEPPKDRPRDSYVLRVVKPFGDWLQRYYKTWKARNQPEASQDTDAFLEAASKPLLINHEELEELRMKEAEQRRIANEIEEDLSHEEVMDSLKRKVEDRGEDFVDETETPATKRRSTEAE